MSGSRTNPRSPGALWLGMAGSRRLGWFVFTPSIVGVELTLGAALVERSWTMLAASAAFALTAWLASGWALHASLITVMSPMTNRSTSVTLQECSLIASLGSLVACFTPAMGLWLLWRVPPLVLLLLFGSVTGACALILLVMRLRFREAQGSDHKGSIVEWARLATGLGLVEAAFGAFLAVANAAGLWLTRQAGPPEALVVVLLVSALWAIAMAATACMWLIHRMAFQLQT